MKNLFILFLLLAYTPIARAQQLTSIESVEYDPVYGRWLVSNGNTVVEVDGTGSPTDYFGTDPEADFGMEVMGNVLYTVVISGGSNNYVKGYDLTSGLEVTSVLISEATFLNGMASDGSHRIWVTDFTAKDIYEIDFSNLSNPIYTLVVNNTVTTPNGICYDAAGSRLVFACWGSNAKIKAVSLPDYTVTTLVENAGVGNIDGIDNDSYGNFYICSWQPVKVKKYNNDFSVEEVITVAGLSQPADLCYSWETDSLAIPSAGNNTVKFVGFNNNSIEATTENPFALQCYPNPVNDRSVLQFTLKEASVVKIEIYDTQGKLMLHFYEENLPAAKHKLVIGNIDIPQGNYFWKLTSESHTAMIPFVK